VIDVRLLALVAVLAAWFGLSACNQIRSGALLKQLRRQVPLGLIPLWTFFAPNPARADSRLVWRFELEGRWSEWKELHFGFAPLARRWLFNPELVENKAVTDLTRALFGLDPELDPRSFLLSSSYITLLSVVLAQWRPPSSTAVQFAVVQTAMEPEKRRIDVAFVSEVHDARASAAHVY
jgi:hypothetical protein